jgi:hypothetical protein
MQRTRRHASLVQQLQAAMTGMITLHSQMYAQLKSKFGKDRARTYGHANEAS